MEKYQEIIPIFFAVDDKYVPFLAVTLQSLLNNASQENYYVIKILYIFSLVYSFQMIIKVNADLVYGYILNHCLKCINLLRELNRLLSAS